MIIFSEPRTLAAARRALTATFAATLVAGTICLASTTHAQAAPDKPDMPNLKADDANRRVVPIAPDEAIDPNQPIKNGFLISVSVVGEPDPSGTYLVDAAGNVGIKYAGIMTPVSVKGMTPTMAADAIGKFLKTYVKNPQVAVSIVMVPQPIIFVNGAVKITGQIRIPQDATLLDVLSKAEWTENADLSSVRVSRDKQNFYYKFDRYIKVSPGETPDETQNPILHDKDRIFVPFKTLPGKGTFSVFGEVDKPAQGLPLPTGTTMKLREAINLVGGAKTTANRRAISIRRPSVDQPIIIDLDKAEQGDYVNNIDIKPDDTIYVEKLDNNAYINVNGGFVKPGKFVYDKRMTLMQAIAEAGDIAPFAKEGEGSIIRHPDGDAKKTRVITFNYKQLRQGKAADIELQPGDSIYIPGGTAPRPALNALDALGALSSVSTIYRAFNGYRY